MSIFSEIFTGGAKSAVESIGNVFKTIIEEFKINPERAAELQQQAAQSLNDHIKNMAELALKEKQAELDAKQAEVDAAIKNTESARAMNSVLQVSDKASWLSKNVAYIIDLFVTALWGSIALYILARIFKLVDHGSDTPDMNAIWGIFAAVTAAFTTVLQFHRGSSVGARQKDEAIQTMVKKF